MTTKQLAILNALVTFAAENVPGGLSEDEREVAQIVGRWTLQWYTKDAIGQKEYEYRIINPTHFPSTEEALNSWADRGWRVVGTTPSSISGRTSPRILYGVILERPVGVSHLDD